MIAEFGSTEPWTMPVDTWRFGATTTTMSGRTRRLRIKHPQKRVARLSNLRAPRTTRLPNPKPMTINPADSRYE